MIGFFVTNYILALGALKAWAIEHLLPLENYRSSFTYELKSPDIVSGQPIAKYCWRSFCKSVNLFLLWARDFVPPRSQVKFAVSSSVSYCFGLFLPWLCPKAVALIPLLSHLSLKSGSLLVLFGPSGIAGILHSADAVMLIPFLPARDIWPDGGGPLTLVSSSTVWIPVTVNQLFSFVILSPSFFFALLLRVYCQDLFGIF